MSEPTGGRGRPPRAEAKSIPTGVRLSPNERAVIQRAAAVNGQRFADFARDALVTAAAECLEASPPSIVLRK